MSAIERKFHVNGYQLTAKEWQPAAPIKVIACHGWLDNAASFDRLAPLLDQCHIIAMDMAGHGRSDHKSLQATYNIWDDLLDILAIADAMGWQKFHLLGHSRGAIMSMLLTAAMPERVHSLMMLDAVLPEPVKAVDTARQMGSFLREQRRARTKKMPLYESVDQAVSARAKAAMMPESTARPIVERGIQTVDGGYGWTTDPRLTTASVVKMTAAHNQAIVDALVIPNLLLIARAGLGASQGFIDYAHSYKQLNIQMLDGSHHFHMEQQAVEIAGIAAEFFVKHDQ
ncbi:alpha/beta fold hydrolase [Oceanicoccus sp. KOV_DT_Chl]|uniref:alpha/beta fold hydrolase n=1 Tax=Oceanicoccus sp. KOV_DT_Chl TaxID=1904639 RepID=UPI000C7A8EB2|nr:alpha/beta hydrolase [Oceanicoccus sp. KOV_DT_Chl]